MKAAPQTMKQIDCRGGIALFKTSIGAYITRPVSTPSGDSTGSKWHKTLHAARLELPPIVHPEKLTPGRDKCPHNLPGYKAGNSSISAKRKK